MHLRSVRTMMSIKNDIEIHDVCIMIGGSQDSGSAVAKSVSPAICSKKNKELNY